ncbi:MAG: glutaminyl-peptide cyclotransferase [Acidimicrobiales bacterium]
MPARLLRQLATIGVAAATVVGCSRIEPSSDGAAVSTIASDPTTSSSAPATSASTTTSVVEATVPTTLDTTTTVPTAAAGVQVLVPEIVNRYPHDPLAFTQGLEFHDDALIEGVGEYGNSARRIVDPVTGTVTAEVKLPLEQFGNGITVSNDRLVQLTWKAGRAIVADPTTLEATGQFDFDGEGWGICAEADRLVMSDGSSRLTVRDPASFEATGSIDVTYDGQPVSNLNELECVDGVIWANRWLTSEILQIDPSTGAVTAIVDAQSLIPTDQTLGQEDVLNGIAYRASSSTFFVTGKRWNTMYEVRFVPAG